MARRRRIRETSRGEIAPNAPPPEMPRMPPSASGFLTSACRARSDGGEDRANDRTHQDARESRGKEDRVIGTVGIRESASEADMRRAKRRAASANTISKRMERSRDSRACGRGSGARGRLAAHVHGDSRGCALPRFGMNLAARSFERIPTRGPEWRIGFSGYPKTRCWTAGISDTFPRKYSMRGSKTIEPSRITSRTHRDNVLHAEMRPLLVGGRSYIVGVRDAQQLVEIRCRGQPRRLADDRPASALVRA